MAEYFAGGHLRFINGEWRDDNGDAIEISRVRHGRWNIDGSCSECHGYDNRDPYGSAFCPHCGAKMDLD